MKLLAIGFAVLVVCWGTGIRAEDVTTAREAIEEQARGLVLTPGVYPTKWTAIDLEGNRYTHWAGDGLCVKEKPVSITGLPPLVSKSPLYGRIEFYRRPLGNDAVGSVLSSLLTTSWLCVLDESKGTGKGYDTLYFDANGNGDLSDDAKAVGEHWPTKPNDSVVANAYGESGMTFENAAELPYNKLYPGDKNSHVVTLAAFYIKERDTEGVIVFIRDAWVGEVDSNKGKTPFQLVDFDDDGSFDGQGPLEKCDRIVFDFTRKGKFNAEPDDERLERVDLMEVNEISGVLYVLKSSADGSQLEVKKYPGPTVTIEVKPAKIGKILLTARYASASGDKGDFSSQLGKGNKQFDVPTGDYHITAWYEVRYDSGKSATVVYSIRKRLDAVNKKVDIFASGNLRLSIDSYPAKPHLKPKQFSQLTARLTISGGGSLEIYGSALSEPQVLLKNQQGRVVSRGTAENSNDEKGYKFCLYTGEGSKLLDKVKPGDYTLEVIFDTGPFAGVLRASTPVVVEAP